VKLMTDTKTGELWRLDERTMQWVPYEPKRTARPNRETRARRRAKTDSPRALP